MAQFNNLEALLVQKNTPLSSQRESFLHFYLEERVGVLAPLQHSAEVLNISRKEIVPFFFMPAWVTGVYNLRGEILWVVDLAHLLGLPPCIKQEPRLDFTILVLQVAEAATATKRPQMLGCIIHELESIESCSFCDFCDNQPLTTRYSIPSTFLQGFWTKSDTEALAVLDIKAIFQSLSQIS
jgi:positive phototaxis protein PixI